MEENVPLLQRVPGRGQGDEAALEAVRRVHGRRCWARRWAASTWRGTSRPRPGAHAGHGEEHAAGHGRHHARARVDDRRDEGRRRSRSSRPSTRRSAIPTTGRTTRAVAVARDAFFENVIAATRFAAADDRARVGKPVDRGRWQMTPPTSNAYYNPLLNEIVFPAGILQPPGFRLEANDAVSYGAIGTVIGHEISHGFDDQGAQVRRVGASFQLVDARGPGRVRGAWEVRGRPVRGLCDRAGPLPQRPAGAGREHRRPGGRQDRVPRVPAVAGGQGSGGHGRRPHPRAAVLRRLGPVPRRRHPHRDAADDGAERPAPGRALPRDGPAHATCPSSRGRSAAPPTHRWCGRRRSAARSGRPVSPGR